MSPSTSRREAPAPPARGAGGQPEGATPSAPGGEAEVGLLPRVRRAVPPQHQRPLVLPRLVPVLPAAWPGGGARWSAHQPLSEAEPPHTPGVGGLPEFRARAEPVFSDPSCRPGPPAQPADPLRSMNISTSIPSATAYGTSYGEKIDQRLVTVTLTQSVQAKRTTPVTVTAAH
jgi:hypothetical protein